MLHSLCVFKGFLKRKIYEYFLQVSCMCYYVILFSSRIDAMHRTRHHHRRCRRRWNPLRHPNNYI